MIEGALVLPPITAGMTLASATRNLPISLTRRRGSTTSPIRQVDVGWWTVTEKCRAKSSKSASLRLGAFSVAVLCRQKRRHHQRTELTVSRPVCCNIHRLVDRRDHDSHVVRIVVVVHADN